MNARKKDRYNTDSYMHIIKYIILVLLSSVIFQIFTDRILSRYELFLTANYDALLVNLFTAQVTIIILPLSIFGIFTEITNEVYLGQSIAEYMYMYRSDHFFSFSYKELVISSMVLTLAEYVLMSKELLAAELTTIVLNTIAMLVSIFSWLEVRIRKEELHEFIQKQLSKKIEIFMKPGVNIIYKAAIIDLLSRLKDWVVNGGDHELVEAMRFYENLNIYSALWDMAILVQNTEKEEPVNDLLSLYLNADYYFDEMVADLLRKQDYYRALRCSNGMLKIIAYYRVKTYYHPNHYHYRILLKLFRKISETEMELLGYGWFYDYLTNILRNGNGYLALTVQTEKTRDSEALQCITEEGYILVYEFLMSVWQNDNLQPEYKLKQLEAFLNWSIMDSGIRNSALCVSMKLMKTKDQTIIDAVVMSNWQWLSHLTSPSKKEEREFLEKYMVLFLAYSYYLAVYTDQDITIPQLTGRIVNTQTNIVNYTWEVLADCACKWVDEIKEFLDRNDKLDGEFRCRYYDVIYSIMLYSAMANRQCPILEKNSTNGYNKVIRYFRYITGDDTILEAVISRYKMYIDLFGVKDTITDQIINDRFYKFKKVILQYYMEPVKKAAKTFDKEAFWEDIKGKVLEELLTDQRFEVNSSNVQVSNEEAVVEAVFSWLYFILPHEEQYNAHKIKKWLCAKILPKNADKEETCSQEIIRTYDVLSLDWKEEELDEKEIEYFINKKQGFKVQLEFYPADNSNIFDMNFRTYEEAYEFVKLEYRKVVFRMEVKI